MIYKLRFDREFYFSINIDVDELFSKMGDDFQFLDGTPRLADWVAPKAEFYAAGNNQALEVPDVSDWLGNLVLSQKAYDALQAH
ncbi:MAG: hypothetical protein MI867_00895, partial [Pseudomonadales bacterium]|nr:hypothetical protein [Pseudomonadales bacterium]